MATFTQARSGGLYAELCATYPECATFWDYFLQLTEIPRPSGHMAQVVSWAQRVGAALGGTVRTDALGNVAIAFAASPGKEHAPGVVLQAHLDMVPTKTTAHTHNFASDPIVPYIDGPLMRARGTTLGGDDGSGVAAALAIAADKKLVRGPLELLFTVDEETGLQGALGMKEGELLTDKAKYLINVDSEDWGEFCLSCAGGADRLFYVPFARTELAKSGCCEKGKECCWETYVLTLQGFRGGHTGVEIQAGRANAIKWAAEILGSNSAATAGAQFRVHTFEGGNAHNAVPSHCVVEFSVPKSEAATFIAAAEKTFAGLMMLFEAVEKTPTKQPTITFKRLDAPTAKKALTFSASRSLIRFILNLPHGIWRWSEEIPTLVETSQSLSKIALKGEGDLMVEVFARSSHNEVLVQLSKQLEDHATLYGGKLVKNGEDSPGWPANPDSALCKQSLVVFEKLFGAAPKLVPIHAGLECGVIMNKFPKNKMEAISVGPTVHNPHTVDEYLDLTTCVKLCKFLSALVESLA